MQDHLGDSTPARLFDLRPQEAPRVFGAFLYFFFLLSGYYTLRPLRDALAVGVGVENMKYLFLSAFICMLLIVPLYGWVVSRIPRRRFLPLVYAFFILNILAFRGWFQGAAGDPWLARVFFVWVSVFNLFVVSVFWSFMADLFNRNQARRLFGLVAAGGSAGAVLGPLVTSQLVTQLGQANLLLVSASLITAALICLLSLLRYAEQHDPDKQAVAQPMGGSVFAGFLLLWRHPFLAGVAAYMFLGTLTGSLLYLQQAKVISLNFQDPAVITSVFAQVDLAINALTIVIQLTLTGRIVKWIGLAATLSLLPVIAVLGFGTITFLPSMTVIIVVQVLRRATLFGITNPASQMIYTIVGPQSKYKFKHFTDTVVYRAGDTSGSWLFGAVLAQGVGLAGAAIVGIIVSAAWAVNGVLVGRRFERIRAEGTHLP